MLPPARSPLDHQAGAPCLSNEPPSHLDLSTLPAGNDNAPFIAFLEKELRRSHLALAYVHRETFSAPIKQDLLPALTLERRFFSRLLQALKPEPNDGDLWDHDKRQTMNDER